jgi:hypothetical protein
LLGAIANEVGTIVVNGCIRVCTTHTHEEACKFRAKCVHPGRNSESPIRRYRAEAALDGPVTVQIDACGPSRDGSERFGSGTQAYGQI